MKIKTLITSISLLTCATQIMAGEPIAVTHDATSVNKIQSQLLTQMDSANNENIFRVVVSLN
jgi:hypothetical protein